MISGHACSSGALQIFLSKIGLKSKWGGWIDGKEQYKFDYVFLLEKDLNKKFIFTTEIVELNVSIREKMLALMQQKNLKVIVFYKDPISVLRTIINMHQIENNCKNRYFLDEKLDCKLPVLGYKYNADNLLHFYQSGFFTVAYYSTFIHQRFLNGFTGNEIIVFDDSSVNEQNVVNTMIFFINKFNLNIDIESIVESFNFNLKISYSTSIFRFLLPIHLKIKIDRSVIEIIINFKANNCIRDDSKLICQDCIVLNNIPLSIHIIKYDVEFIVKYKKEILDKIYFFINLIKSKYEYLENDKIHESHIINFLRINNSPRNFFRNMINEEFYYIKQHRPDIVASWKYYQEFEKMCEELDGKEDSLKENISNN
ncbi:DUF2972 domain-containing protein, partial [Campylobacter insulaenigrae]|uniref:DUF2972 domain-containing protein n=1 Tax=Campylobacter insulaenigrae TaxID=260714 RepID=UPI0021526FB3